LQFNQLPADINVQLLDESDEIEATLAPKRKLEEVAANDCSELLDDTDVNSIDKTLSSYSSHDAYLFRTSS
jgi:hypothetical protein